MVQSKAAVIRLVCAQLVAGAGAIALLFGDLASRTAQRGNVTVETSFWSNGLFGVAEGIPSAGWIFLYVTVTMMITMRLWHMLRETLSHSFENPVWRLWEILRLHKVPYDGLITAGVVGLLITPIWGCAYLVAWGTPIGWWWAGWAAHSALSSLESGVVASLAMMTSHFLRATNQRESL
ncbi:MAG: hypothetical protein O3A46_03170 [Candidatus Poribacteria bacterium]|nr:hypothetical protein [Candidatus Poribacteria bacterium]